MLKRQTILGTLASLAGMVIAWAYFSFRPESLRVPNWLMVCALGIAAASIAWISYRWATRHDVIGHVELRIQSQFRRKMRPLLVVASLSGLVWFSILMWRTLPGIQDSEWRALLFLTAGAVWAFILLSSPEIGTRGVAFGGQLIRWHDVAGFSMSALGDQPVLVLHAKPEVRTWARKVIPISANETTAIQAIVATRVPLAP